MLYTTFPPYLVLPVEETGHLPPGSATWLAYDLNLALRNVSTTLSSPWRSGKSKMRTAARRVSGQLYHCVGGEV